MTNSKCKSAVNNYCTKNYKGMFISYAENLLCFVFDFIVNT